MSTTTTARYALKTLIFFWICACVLDVRIMDVTVLFPIFFNKKKEKELYFFADLDFLLMVIIIGFNAFVVGTMFAMSFRIRSGRILSAISLFECED